MATIALERYCENMAGNHLLISDDHSFWRVQIEKIVLEPGIMRFMIQSERADVYIPHERRWALQLIIMKSFTVPRDTRGQVMPDGGFCFDLPVSGHACIMRTCQDDIPEYL
ncbi:MAG: hypothetical protein P4M11_05925 [Candidatus Pacebacteria bacterium]|nr:hypothetical protein [Candidatus Paceibacterota bacterium]